ncbi:MAG: Hydroxyacylglutathione hydrolase [Promethearchaeota archaeon]|nr:MAG: Hydroxyacylglutathione hydrolase [Candidatus Lokiarchaeota archaeon]
MIEDSNHFTVKIVSEDIYIIQEDISIVNAIYTNDPINLYLILGARRALLIDTGCGICPLKPIIDALIDDRQLTVINSHAHWDHILGNNEFEEVYIHENEAHIVSNPYDLSHNKDIFEIYSKRNYKIPACEKIKTLKHGDVFNLDTRKIEVIHTPGHSSGSICLLLGNQELFTGDVAYYGDQFLPSKQKIPLIEQTLLQLIDMVKKRNIQKIYPSHQQTPCTIDLLTELLEGIQRIEKLWQEKRSHRQFFSWIIEDPFNKKFRYIISRF